MVDVTSNILCVPVPNDGIMEEETNAYIIHDTRHGGLAVVIDPGSEAGTAAILAALGRLGDPPVRQIILTHAHPDHAGGAAALRAATGAPVWLHPDELPVAERLRVSVPVDGYLADGQVLEVAGLTFDAVLTPGHAAGHVVFIERATGVTVAGDMVHGRGTVGIFPPYGSMRAYLHSLQRMLDRGVTQLLPGHGPAIADGPATLRRYIAHRLAREQEIVDYLAAGVETIPDLVARLYPDLAPRSQFAARATVHAHLEKLAEDRRVVCEGTGEQARYRVVG
ncbi:MAG: MBL fold metallo-hydrolase [Sphaerobacter sp.]|nr:MBL fold metallo-hydrolase [Sphaerobacter sp.]